MASPQFDFGSHAMSHFASYLRLGFLLISFLFVKNQPVLFLMIVLFSTAVGILDKWFSSCGPPRQKIETKLLNECVDKVSLY